ncbi:molybdenum cofactor guanylyltransferase MobA [Brucellaceae bacterium C25G]
MSAILPRHIPVVILAGGRSSRMQTDSLSGDKYLHFIGHQCVLSHLIERLKLQSDHIILNANDDQADLSRFDLPVIGDQLIYNSGPLSGILTAMDYAKEHPLVFTAAADTPFIPLNLIEKMLHNQQETQSDVVFAQSNATLHPTFGLWRTDLAQKLHNWLKTGSKPSVTGFAADLKQSIVDFPFAVLADGTSYDPFFNINEPEDLKTADSLQKRLSHEQTDF